MANEAYFNRTSLQFLKDLRANNERDWFLKNKDRYEDNVRGPLLRLISDLKPRLKKISPYFVADPKPVGGSMMRINRDIRFSPDKSPYKTALGAHFWHAQGEERASPAFYLHVEPKASMIGGGLWRPEPAALKSIRDAIVADAKTWGKITRGKQFAATCGLSGESLKRPPPGYDAAHPYIDDLKRKDFITSISLTDGILTSAELMDTLVDSMKTTAPFMQFLTKSLGIQF